MRGRDPDEAHRTATPLELFVDLCFVVAVAQASESLHEAFTHGRYASGALRFALVFFTIWWAWMNFTWFASAYDPGDTAYRLTVLVQVTGSLVLAAGVSRAFSQGDLLVITLGYVIMRTALAALWLRAGLSDPARRGTAFRFAAGVSVCQAGWVVLLLLPTPARLPGIVLMILAEVIVPVWAQSAGMTPWHPRHIAERYELFTLIVLGESIAAATIAVRGAFDRNHGSGALYALACGGLLMAFAMWWLYFTRPAHVLLATSHQARGKRFTWAYGHYLVFASATAEGAGLAAYADHLTRPASAASDVAALAVTAPAAIFLVTVWAVHLRPHQTRTAEGALFLFAAVGILMTTWFSAPALVAGLLLSGLTAVVTVRQSPGADRTRKAARRSYLAPPAQETEPGSKSA
ncbi:low temperature requirement protein A [Streptomyces lancefieldiae]|uniref:Low temperature requirement protein A n=1 Tax=Streptomyces lancefieldiae TaxID=3075520 RepID=A0ABU3B0P8_9ACTN|nr:low temperature requirement protein A [Streptomyces sp. DSM 40712]MDT0616028.1 low temperature requirement protein A [Streptomyces sp. DSM 40712]